MLMQQEPLTKENILRYVGEEQIFERYLGIPVVFGRRIINPLRSDDNPDCEFYYGAKKLFFSDYAFPEYGGDCFQIAAFANGLTLPQDFFKVLRIINRDFSLNLFDGYLDSIADVPVSRPEIIRDIVREAKKKAQIVVKACKFSDLDLLYWSQFGITTEILKKFHVFRAKEVWINGYLFYEYSKDDLCFIYYFVETGTYKIYRPFARRELKWRTNSSQVMGLEQLKPGNDIIITKGLKDVMTLSSIGFQAICNQSEGANFEESLIKRIISNYPNRLVLYDNDDAGIKGAEKTAKAFECDYLIIDKSFEVKDPSAFYQAYDGDLLRDIIINSQKWKFKT